MFRSLIDALGRLFGGGALPRRVRKEFPPGALDFDAQKIVRRLRRVGQAETYLVGGGVRDLLLGRKPKDFDVATSASPWQVRKLFRNSRLIGRRFLLNHIFFRGGKIIEVSTFRKRPVQPEGTEEAPAEPLKTDNEFGNAEEDAKRRDFTVNGLFYDEEKSEVLDYVGGLRDLSRKLIRSIGDPEVRFKEDPIRMLRAVKFAAKLDFKIEPATAKAILDHGSELHKASLPRLVEEILRLFSSSASERSLEILRQTKLLAVILPELPTPLPAALPARLRALDALQAQGDTPSHALIWAALFWDQAEGSMKTARGQSHRFAVGDLLHPLGTRLRASRKDMDMARLTLLSQGRFEEGESRRRGAAEGFLPKPYFRDAILLHYLRLLSAGEPAGSRAWNGYASWRRRWLERNSQAFLPEAGPPKAGAMAPPRPVSQPQAESPDRGDRGPERSQGGRDGFRSGRDRGFRGGGRRDQNRRDRHRGGGAAPAPVQDQGEKPAPAEAEPVAQAEGVSTEAAPETGKEGRRDDRRDRRRFEGRRHGRGRDRGRRQENREQGGGNRGPEAPPMAKQGIEDRKELAKEMSEVELKEDQTEEAKSFFDGNV